MPHLIDTESRVATLVRAINDQLVLHGSGGLTLRRVARTSGVSPSSMLHHLGSRERLVQVALHRTAGARIASIEARLPEGPAAFLPAYAEDLLDLRAWLAWQELWRSEPSLEPMMARAREAELGLLARLFGYQRPLDDLEAVAALLNGLAVDLCHPSRPMSPARATELVMSYVRARGWWPVQEQPDVTLPRRPVSWW
jgi:TetR/AcrR family transcriptional repressor of bet genes